MHLSSVLLHRCRNLPLLAAVLCAGCGPAFGTFSKRQSEAVCLVTTTCFDSHGNVDACVQDIGVDRDEVSRRDDCPGYRKARARHCLRALDEQADDCPTHDPDLWRVPSVCAEVCRDDRDAEPGRTMVQGTDTAW